MSGTLLSSFDTIREKMLDDPNYAWTWHHRIVASVLYSVNVSSATANMISADLMQTLFAIDIRTNPNWRTT